MTDPFETFGIAANYDLDLKELATRHRALSKALHPDRYADRSAAERRLALNKAIEVNSAWRTLRDPIQRAVSLLQIQGVSQGETKEPKPPMALLMEMMEVREELSGAHRSKNLEAVARLDKKMRAKESKIGEQLRSGFASAEALTDYEKLLPLLAELRYVRRFFEELEAVEEDLIG
jgi:molecular chaperone HscB